jgi:hypothetical protein
MEVAFVRTKFSIPKWAQSQKMTLSSCFSEGTTLATYHLNTATDRNNEEHPDGVGDNEICYYIIGKHNMCVY